MRVRRGQDRVPVGVEGRLVAVIAAASGGKRQNHLIRCGMLFEHVCFGTLYTHTHTFLYLPIGGKERIVTGRNFVVVCVCGAAVCMLAAKTDVRVVKSFSMLQRPVCKWCPFSMQTVCMWCLFSMQQRSGVCGAKISFFLLTGMLCGAKTCVHMGHQSCS